MTNFALTPRPPLPHVSPSPPDPRSLKFRPYPRPPLPSVGEGEEALGPRAGTSPASTADRPSSTHPDPLPEGPEGEGGSHGTSRRGRPADRRSMGEVRQARTRGPDE